jgi:hypothetical protein
MPSLYPLFPGSNELDQLSKIHDVLGSPSAALLGRIRKNGSHARFDFPAKPGTGLAKLLPHISADCLSLLDGLLQCVASADEKRKKKKKEKRQREEEMMMMMMRMRMMMRKRR